MYNSFRGSEEVVGCMQSSLKKMNNGRTRDFCFSFCFFFLNFVKEKMGFYPSSYTNLLIAYVEIPTLSNLSVHVPAKTW